MTGNSEQPTRAKRTITEIRDSKRSGEKMVYTSVPDYTSAQWAEMAGVDVAVVGDSLAMIAHGHSSTVPATMDMMVMHAQAVRRGAPNTFVLGCMPYQSYNTADRALTNATRFMQEAGCDAVKPQGGKTQAHILAALVDAGIPTASHIGLTPHTVAMFGGFKVQGRSAESAMKILEDALAIQDAGQVVHIGPVRLGDWNQGVDPQHQRRQCDKGETLASSAATQKISDQTETPAEPPRQKHRPTYGGRVHEATLHQRDGAEHQAPPHEEEQLVAFPTWPTPRENQKKRQQDRRQVECAGKDLLRTGTAIGEERFRLADGGLKGLRLGKPLPAIAQSTRENRDEAQEQAGYDTANENHLQHAIG